MNNQGLSSIVSKSQWHRYFPSAPQHHSCCLQHAAVKLAVSLAGKDMTQRVYSQEVYTLQSYPKPRCSQAINMTDGLSTKVYWVLRQADGVTTQQMQSQVGIPDVSMGRSQSLS